MSFRGPDLRFGFFSLMGILLSASTSFGSSAHHGQSIHCKVSPDENILADQSTFHVLLKSAEELKDYLTRHYKDDTPDSYVPLVHAAANVFELPEQFLTCLFFKESVFNSKAKSESGAKGIAQLTPLAAKEIHRQVATQSGLKPPYRDLWEEYFDAISANIKSCPVPNGFSLKQVSDPITSIGGGALLARIYFDRLNSERPNIKKTDLYVFLAAAYNMGLYGFEQVCGPSVSLDACKRKINPETYSQMVAVQNCIEPNNWESMTVQASDAPSAKAKRSQSSHASPSKSSHGSRKKHR